MVLKTGATILPSVSFRKGLHELEKVLSLLIVMFHTAECFVHDETNMCTDETYSTVHIDLKQDQPF
jgi:hypothetical protein